MIHTCKFEKKKLWEITIWDKKFNSVERYKQPKVETYRYYLANELKELIDDKGDIKILTTSITNLYALESSINKDDISEGNIIAIPWGGNPIIQFYSGKFITSDNRIARSIDESKYNIKYIYYYLNNKKTVITSFYRGSGIKHPDMSKVLDLDIEIPPIEEQNRIVKILDNYNNIKNSLVVNLKEDIIRYNLLEEYYINLLLFKPSYDKYKMRDLCSVSQGLQIPISQRKKEPGPNRYKYITVQYLNGKSAEEYIENPIPSVLCDKEDILVTRTGSTGKIISNVEGCFHNNFFKVNCNENIMRDYMFEMLSSKRMYNTMLKEVSGGTVPDLPHKKFYDIEVGIAPLCKQQEIASTIVKLRRKVFKINNELLKEIDLIEKQYQYYMEKLLSFNN